MAIPSLLVMSATALLTSIGAAALTWHEVSSARQLADQAAPVLAARARVIRLSNEIEAAAPLFARPTVSATIERVARALPSDAHIGSIAVEADGSLALAIDTPDPDRLRDALRQDPVLAALRERNQAARTDGHIRVTLDGRGL